MLERTAFVAMRDDHDHGIQDANSTNLPRSARRPGTRCWAARAGYRFGAGLAEVWVLDQRRFKSDPALPDDAGKTLLGRARRAWLMRTLAASTAPFKVVCSPCTVFMPANARDGSWASRYAERDLLLAPHRAPRSAGRRLFVTGDTHLTGVYESGPRFEARAAPLDIPVPNDVTLLDPLAAPNLRRRPGVAYADERGHFALLEVRGGRGAARLDIALVREDGAVPYRRSFRLAR